MCQCPLALGGSKQPGKSGPIKFYGREIVRLESARILRGEVRNNVHDLLWVNAGNIARTEEMHLPCQSPQRRRSLCRLTGTDTTPA